MTSPDAESPVAESPVAEPPVAEPTDAEPPVAESTVAEPTDADQPMTPGPTVLDELVTRVLAPNPGPMTLDGTNTYVLGRPGSGAAVVVDPGPLDETHLAAVEAAIGDAEVAAVVITHHHVDHAEAAGWATTWGAPLRAYDRGLVPGADPLRDGERLGAGGLDLVAVHTPGHASDHLCLRVAATDVLLTGDHVLGRGTSVVNWPDGDMAAYLESLERLRDAPGSRIYPGHGPTVDDPPEKVTAYLLHREDRTRQVLDAIAGGAADTDAIVRAVYTDVPEHLHPAAARSVNAVLVMLADRGRVPEALRPAPPGGPSDDPSRSAG